ncbi:glycosyltransferase family 2 protein [Granulosicoccus sp. 3-233]|uniref:glycosyltransferase family 2 protein n=1 Tax=Granulosicoccus sp. 3-233 TaxID=3417969 RepID=UPI003D33E1A1
MTTQSQLTVVVPAYNESANIKPLMKALVPVLEGLGLSWNIIFVDDGSKDDTVGQIEDLHAAEARVGLLSFSRNFGKEIAIAAGLQRATGDAVVIMDADLQHPPELIQQFVGLWKDGYQMVYGQRVDRDADSLLRRSSSRAFYKVFERLSGTHLPEGAGDYRLLDRKAVDALNSMPERARFTKGLYSWIGFRAIGVPFHIPPREAGESRFNAATLLRFATDGLVSFSTLPLRVWSYLGLVISVISFIYAAILVFETLVFGIDVPGYPTIVVSIMLFSGVQLMSLGMIGEYIGRIYEEGKARPLYIVADEVGVPPANESSADREKSALSVAESTALETGLEPGIESGQSSSGRAAKSSENRSKGRETGSSISNSERASGSGKSRKEQEEVT